jgi:transketolase
MIAEPVLSRLQEITSSGNQETRKGFGDGACELARINPNVVALSADLAGSLRLDKFIEEFPDRFFQCGVAEANMIGVAAGLTIGGKVPLATTFANFATGRVYDQIRQSVAYSNKPVKICASHAGLTLGEDGATHQILEDIGMMRMLPHMTVIVPCDYNQTKAATLSLPEIDGPVYMRFGRPKVPNFTPGNQVFQVGKAEVLAEGDDVSLFACGHLVWKAIEAARLLESQGISVELINVHTIKPLDVDAVLASVTKTGCAVTAEEHQRYGGLGGAISEVLVQHEPVPMEMVAVNDTFGESGTPEALMAKYGLESSDIVRAVQRVLTRRA